MRLSLILTGILIIIVTVIVSSPQFNLKVNGITNVNNTYFSIIIPDNWTYAEHSKMGMSMGESHGNGSVNLVALAPADFAKALVVNENKDSPYGKMFNGGAYSTLRLDTDYPNKNSTLGDYAKYRINSIIPGINLTSQQNTIVGNEKAIRIDGNGLNKLKNLNYVAYLVLHDKVPYYLEYIANTKDFQKYLPQFEQMIKTFKFVK
jgi:hypothetical protein